MTTAIIIALSVVVIAEAILIIKYRLDCAKLAISLIAITLNDE